jgi:hypothetical protein
MKIWIKLALIASCSLLAFPRHADAQESSENDLRDVRVGMAVADLPATGYVGFACTADAGRKVSGWANWRDCPAGEDGLHALRFGYDPATSRDGTIVAGHPAILTLLVDDAGTVAGLKIETDPAARLYLRKKAFLFASQVKARYGDDDWNCSQSQPGAGEESVGGVYLNERCTKSTRGRAVIVERRLFRRAGQSEKDFVDETRVTIMKGAA